MKRTWFNSAKKPKYLIYFPLLVHSNGAHTIRAFFCYFNSKIIKKTRKIILILYFSWMYMVYYCDNKNLRVKEKEKHFIYMKWRIIFCCCSMHNVQAERFKGKKLLEWVWWWGGIGTHFLDGVCWGFEEFLWGIEWKFGLLVILDYKLICSCELWWIMEGIKKLVEYLNDLSFKEAEIQQRTSRTPPQHVCAFVKEVRYPFLEINLILQVRSQSKRFISDATEWPVKTLVKFSIKPLSIPITLYSISCYDP